MSAIRVVLTDDHPIVLDGLRRLFEAQEGFEVAAFCGSGTEALMALRRCQPDMLVLDVALPDMDGLTVLRRMKSDGLAAAVVLLTAGVKEAQLLEAVGLGIQGFVLKQSAPEHLVEAVRSVHSGHRWFDGALMDGAIELLLRHRDGLAVADNLTAREREVMGMVGAGLSNRDIAERLTMSEGTVKIHLHHIYTKLKVRRRLELTLLVREVWGSDGIGTSESPDVGGGI
jgi:DNA-binding NarL/FixJ family response regulator